VKNGKEFTKGNGPVTMKGRESRFLKLGTTKPEGRAEDQESTKANQHRSTRPLVEKRRRGGWGGPVVRKGISSKKSKTAPRQQKGKKKTKGGGKTYGAAEDKQPRTQKKGDQNDQGGGKHASTGQKSIPLKTGAKKKNSEQGAPGATNDLENSTPGFAVVEGGRGRDGGLLRKGHAIETKCTKASSNGKKKSLMNPFAGKNDGARRASLSGWWEGKASPEKVGGLKPKTTKVHMRRGKRKRGPPVTHQIRGIVSRPWKNQKGDPFLQRARDWQPKNDYENSLKAKRGNAKYLS